MSSRLEGRWSADELAWLRTSEGRAIVAELRSPRRVKNVPVRAVEERMRQRALRAVDPQSRAQLLALLARGIELKDLAAVVGVHQAKLALLRDDRCGVDVDFSGVTVEKVGNRMMPVRSS